MKQFLMASCLGWKLDMANKTYFLLSLLFLLSSCATTLITSPVPHAKIYMDGVHVGDGTASVSSIGPPRKAQIEAKVNGQNVAIGSMGREFKFKTVLWGVISYYTGFYWGWYYPENFQIPLIYRPNEKSSPVISPWLAPSESIWMQPLN